MDHTAPFRARRYHWDKRGSALSDMIRGTCDAAWSGFPLSRERRQMQCEFAFQPAQYFGERQGIVERGNADSTFSTASDRAMAMTQYLIRFRVTARNLTP